MSEQLSLSDVIGETEAEHRARIDALRKRLENLAHEMLLEDAANNGPGITFVAVRLAAETRGWLTGEEQGRTLSFGSTVMKHAGGVVHAWVRSKHRNSNRRLVASFKLSTVAEPLAEAEPR